MNKPKPEDFGYQTATGFDSESGWMEEGGEEAYYEALEKWNKANASFTPGPWLYTNDEHFMYGVDGDPVCRVRGITPEIRNANAALIAVAPEMLEALEMVLLIWQSGIHIEEIIPKIEGILKKVESSSGRNTEEYLRVKQIIKKAKGE